MSESVYVLHFSPTGSTKELAERIGAGLPGKVVEIDLSDPGVSGREFEKEDVVVVAFPVFGGRIPEPGARALRKFGGNGATAAAVVVYGNRHYDDALIELNDLLSERGFGVAASAALVARHSIVKEIAASRPDREDFAEIDAFAEKLRDKLSSARPEKNDPPSVPGNRPYKELQPSPPITPLTLDSCTKCGICARKCPVGAIPEADPTQTAAEKCFRCMRCVWICPEKARVLPEAFHAKVAGMLNQVAVARRENEFYF